MPTGVGVVQYMYTYDDPQCRKYINILPKFATIFNYKQLLQSVRPSKHQPLWLTRNRDDFRKIYLGIVLYAIKNNVYINKHQLNCALKCAQQMLKFHKDELRYMPVRSIFLIKEIEILTTCRNMSKKEFEMQLATGALKSIFN